ncbi:Gfo/Idh/MocA family oxidoreductase [Coraliomargarita akajimensis]|uniref:Oxidoreductase domain protein n=1 Tax=Coraliomargarita akajimensis (strain DSM 45221 / IAM 15411 / JCM 23193 / KCTC 12865 / 04OKA010-24) TaxID=583355 RepID=D5EN10_CORAD|nr:Gfo/Idh/MocA family oxidoreductase [Coraliomargarita akajimensis]ADE53445.1 oxidoreductase domain protein [Coraliomargarita akajimensis DSM 45221]
MNTERRDFLKKSSAAVGAATILPSYIALGNQSSSGITPPSERVNVAFIGSANKGYRNRKAFLASGICNPVALCDVHLEQDQVQESAAEHPQAKLYRDFRVMFDEMSDEIDAVVVSTPDHTHFPASMAAMAHGKAVWCEKPLAHTFGQCERLMDLAERSGVVTQMGNQGHSGANYFQFKAWSEAGVIKDITKIDAYQVQGSRWNNWAQNPKFANYISEPIPEGMDWDTWCSVSPKRPFSQFLHPNNWRGWHEFGCGKLGDWAAHVIDTPHRFLKLGYPEKVTAVMRDDPHPLIYPRASHIRFNFAARGEGLPACELNWHDGPGNYPEIPEEYRDLKSEQADYQPAPGSRPPRSAYVGKIMYGKDLVFRAVSHSEPLRIVPKQKYMDMRRSLPRFPQKNSDHWKNFLLSCKGEEETRSPFSVAGTLSQVLAIGMISQRLGGELHFDSKSQQFTNSAEANALLDPAPRKGWEEFYQM